MNPSILLFLFYVLSIIWNFTAGYFYFQSVSCCLKRKKGKFIFLAGWLGYTITASLVIFPKDMVNISIAAILFFLFNLILYQGKWTVKLALVFVIFPISSALKLLSFDIAGHCLTLFYKTSDHLPNVIFSSLSDGMAALFWFLFYRFFHQSFEKIQDYFTDRTWGIISIICSASFLGVFSCSYLVQDERTYLIWPCILTCMITNMGSIPLASYLADGICADLERKNLQLQKNYYQELESNQNQIRKLHHDINNHFAVIGELLKKGEQKEAEHYLAVLSNSIPTTNRKFCENSIVNAVLNAKYNQITEAKIDAFFHICMDGMMFIDDVSLCTIFANTLDNAIEACQKIEEVSKRTIQLKCRYTENGYFSFELINSKCNVIGIKKGQYQSDKEEKKIHGIGISSVKEIVEKYDGTLDISYTENSFQVVILIGAFSLK